MGGSIGTGHAETKWEGVEKNVFCSGRFTDTDWCSMMQPCKWSVNTYQLFVSTRKLLHRNMNVRGLIVGLDFSTMPISLGTALQSIDSCSAGFAFVSLTRFDGDALPWSFAAFDDSDLAAVARITPADHPTCSKAFYSPPSSLPQTSASQWGGAVCGVSGISSWEPASNLASIARDISFASFCGLAAILLPALPHHPNRLLTKFLVDHFDQGRSLSLWFRCPIWIHGTQVVQSSWTSYRHLLRNCGAMQLIKNGGGTWCNRMLRGRVALVPEFTDDSGRPGSSSLPLLGEYIPAVIFGVKELQFSTQQDQWYGGAHPAAASFLRALFIRGSNPTLRITTSSRSEIATTSNFLSNFLSMPMQRRPGCADDPFVSFCDVIQVPLQPLGHHLTTKTYSVFEADVVKYREYKAAIEACLDDWATNERAASTVLILIGGAGRGPLVSCAIAALSRRHVNGHILVIEKNPEAVTFLRQRAIRDGLWAEFSEVHGPLSVIQGDMRDSCMVRSAVQSSNSLSTVDLVLVVSELLGSFGDNELSPECLDPLLATLRESLPSSKIWSIPSSYSSWISPAFSQHLANTLMDQVALPLVGRGALRAIPDAFQSLYVVKLRTIAPLPTDNEDPSNWGDFGIRHFQKVWSFAHNEENTSSDRDRTATLQFESSGCGSVNCLIGAFTSVLYSSKEFDSRSRTNTVVAIGNIPGATTPTEMQSWFPVYFPLLFGNDASDELTIGHDDADLSLITVTLERQQCYRPHQRSIAYRWKVVLKRRDGTIASESILHNEDGRHCDFLIPDVAVDATAGTNKWTPSYPAASLWMGGHFESTK